VALPQQGRPCLLLDGGANADCTPEHLVQFALIGQAYMAGVYNIEKPTVGLLNIGTEEGKGNKFSKEAFDVLKAEPLVNFYGNVEGRHLFLGGCDVAVCDGFTGNVAIKSAEGMVTLFGRLLKAAFMQNAWTKLLGILVKPILTVAKKHLDHEELGGALLLGICQCH
jgi:phosphate acyltransferase